MGLAHRFKRFVAALAAVCSLLGFSTPAPAQPVNHTNVLIIGTLVAPPFAMKRADGSWEGISIDLWRQVAEQLQLKYEFREMPLSAMLNDVASNKLDAAVAAIFITADRQRKMDFTHSYYSAGLAIAVRTVPDEEHLPGILRGLFTTAFFELLAALMLVVALAGAMVWWFEKNANHAQFGGRWWQGLGSGFWWSAATMTTTGYGDKTPRTFAGRLVAVFWMFAGLVIISSFIASVTASMTVKHFNQSIRGFEDLAHRRVAAVTGTISETYLRQRRITVINYPSGEASFKALVDGRVDAFVNDTPLLLYAANQMQGAITVVPQTFDPQGYGIALPPGSSIYRSVDVTMLEIISSPEWQDTLNQYLGSHEK